MGVMSLITQVDLRKYKDVSVYEHLRGKLVVVGKKMFSCLRGLDAEDKMRGMAAHSLPRAHGLIRDNGSYLIHHVDLVKEW